MSAGEIICSISSFLSSFLLSFSPLLMIGVTRALLSSLPLVSNDVLDDGSGSGRGLFMPVSSAGTLLRCFPLSSGSVSIVFTPVLVESPPRLSAEPLAKFSFLLSSGYQIFTLLVAADF